MRSGFIYRNLGIFGYAGNAGSGWSAYALADIKLANRLDIGVTGVTAVTNGGTRSNGSPLRCLSTV